MSSWTTSDVWTASVALKAPEVQTGQILFSSSSGYSVLEFIGEGCFGKVAKCRKLATKQTVAVKILKDDDDILQDTGKEVSMLKTISILNPDLTNVVKFFERFEHMGQTCLVFEMLDRSLYDLLHERDWEPLSLNEIRPIAKQMFVALDALKVLGIVHTDIKPDNVMFVSVQNQPLRVKLIDFGAAIPASEVQVGMEVQPTGYRAPEVTLGLPFTEAIDVWGVGCVLAFLYLADNLFQVDCEYQMMKSMVEILGHPEERLLHAGKYTRYFFSEQKAADGPTWRLMTPEEYAAANNMKPEERKSFTELPSSLDDLVNIYPIEDAAEFKDRKAFVHLMKGLLHLDGEQRISPHHALLLPFITMSHLSGHPDGTAYLTTSQTLMSVCPVEASADSSSEDDAPSSRSCDSHPSTLSFDAVPFTYYRDEDAAAWPPDRDQEFSEETPRPGSSVEKSHSSNGWLPDDQLPSCSHHEDAAVWSNDGVKPTDVTAVASSVHTKNVLNRIQRFIDAFCCCCTAND